MSEPVRVAVAVEGPTDEVVIEAIIDVILGGSDFEFQVLQPDSSTVFGAGAGSGTGLGWPGVFRWCRQSSMEGSGSVSSSAVFANHDLVVVHVDADIASSTYARGGIFFPSGVDLPCEQPCPPASATTNALREVVLNWLGEVDCPDRLVLCIPSKSMDAWTVVALWPDNHLVARGNWECRQDPGRQFSAVPHGERLAKTREDFERRANDIASGWPIVPSKLTEADRFQVEFLRAMDQVNEDRDSRRDN